MFRISTKRLLILLVLFIVINSIFYGCTNNTIDQKDNKVTKPAEEYQERVWSVDLKEPISSYTVDEENKILYCITESSILYQIDIVKGSILKKVDLQDKAKYDLNMILYDGELILSNTRGYVAVVDIESSKVIKKDKLVQTHMPYIICDDDTLYYSGQGINVKATDLNTFELKWKYLDENTSQHTHVEATLSDGKIYLHGVKDEVIVLDSKNGQVIDKFDLPIATPFLIEDNYLYAQGGGLDIFKLDKNTGKVFWRLNTSARRLFIDKDYLYYFSDSRRIVRVDKINGRELFEIVEFKDMLDNLKTTEKLIIVRGSSGKTVIFNKDNGEKVWEFNSERFPYNREFIIIHENKLIIPEGNGNIHMFDIDKINDQIMSQKESSCHMAVL